MLATNICESLTRKRSPRIDTTHFILCIHLRPHLGLLVPYYVDCSVDEDAESFRQMPGSLTDHLNGLPSTSHAPA
jgi:hypothetical protein